MPNFDLDQVPAAIPDNAAVGTAGDFAKQFGAGAADVGSGLAGAARYFYEAGKSENGADIARGLQEIFGAGGDAARDSMNPETRKLAASAMTSPEFWDHPLLATSLKATGMAPSVVALAIPGGLLADTVAASMAVAGGGAALNAGSGIDEFYKKLDAMSDSDLQQQSPRYAAMREFMDERDARSKFSREALGWAPAINAIIGAGAAAIGPAGTAARRLAGGAGEAVAGAGGRGALAAGAIGGAEGALGNAVQGGAADVLSQNADIEAGFQKDLDVARAANAALEGGVLGGLTGGVAGALLHGRAPDAASARATTEKLDSADTSNPVASNDTANPQPPSGTSRATATPAKPVESAQVGNPQSAPARSDIAYPKKGGKKAPKNDGGGPATPLSPDPAQTAAIEAMNPPGTGAAPNVNETIARLSQAPEAQPAPVTPEVAQPQAPPVDTGMNAPEQPAAIQAQQEQVGQGNRKAVMYPAGSKIPPKPDGLARINTPRGVVDFDPRLISAKQVVGAVAQGKENEILGLGPVSKPEVLQRVAAGEQPTAVTERTPAGDEVKGALGTEQTAPLQMKVLDQNKTPGNTVQIENPAAVVEKRNAGGGRVLPNLTQTAETVPIKPLTKADEARNQQAAERAARGEEEPVVEKTGGKNYSAKEKQARDERLAKSKDIVDRNAPDDRETDYMRNVEHRDAVIARARAMVKEAEDAGVKIQNVLKRSAKSDAASDDPAVQVLTLAKGLLKVAERRKAGKELTDAVGRFKQDETMVRAGMSEDVLANRRAEGDEKMGRRRANENMGGEEAASPAPVEENVVEATPQAAAREAQDQITTATQVSKRPVVLDDAGEERTVKTKGGTEEKVTAAKAANAGRSLSAEEKAAIAERMGLGVSKGKPERAPTKAEPKSPQQDALRVNRNPTDGQIRAGNYKKGHRNVEGLSFTIENPKGAVRRGVGEDGQRWEVRMPADYGYIRRTVGADGDHIDAYDLRSGKRNFVVDQLDHRTGEFDEHKVILRAKDEEHARDAYENAFSDGRAGDRMGHVHEVTREELHDWLKTGDHTQSHLEHALKIERDPGAVNFDVPEGPNRVKVLGGDTVKVVRSAKAADELAALDFSKMEGVGGVLGKFFASRLQKLAGDAEIHYVTPEVMRSISDNGQANLGLHIGQDGKSQVFVSTAAKEGLGVGGRAHVILHELAHRVTVNEINSVPSAERVIRDLARVAAERLNNNVAEMDLQYGTGVLDYGFTNAKEFIAEAFSNPKFQEFLAHTPIPPELAKALRLDKRTPMSLWDAFRSFVKKAIEKVTGVMPQFDSVLDGVMRVSEHLTKVHEVNQAALRENPHSTRQEALRSVEDGGRRIVDGASEAVKRILEDARANTQERGPALLKLRTFDNIAQIADHFFGKESNPIRKVYNAIERMRVTAEGNFAKAEPLIRKLANLRSANGEQFAEFSSLLHDATLANVHPDVALTDAKNAHLGKKRIVGEAVWSKAQHPELARRYRALSPELKDAWHEVNKYFRDQQNQMSLGIIENRILKMMGVEDTALAQRIHEGNATDADKARIGKDMFDVIEQAGELSKIEGPYVPLVRRGDHVVKGDYKINAPAGAKEIAPNEFEFKTEQAATDYAKAQDLKATLKKVWVDENTGETHETDPATGAVHKVSAQDLNAVPRYRVEVQNRHVEFVQGRAAAERRAAELAAAGDINVHKVVPRAYEVGGRQGAELSASLQRLVSKLEKSEAYKQSTPTQQAMLRQAVQEAAAASHGSTRIQSKSLPRRNVAGYSEDLVRNMGDYGESSSRYLAKLEHMPAVEAGMKEMEEQLKRDHSKVNQYGRTTIRNEVVRRVQGDNGFEQGGKFSPVVKRAMAISFIDKLASPAYSVINAMQPAMVTMPYLSGKYGLARSVAALAKAYSDISAKSIIAQGARETVKRARGRDGADDFITNAKALLKSADEQAMIQHMVDHGVIDPSAGMEVRALTKDYSGIGGKIDAGIGYLEGVTREMPRAVEAVNRLTTALASYRLDRAAGRSHEQAMQAAQDAVNSTQFNYSPTNSPPVFNHPLAKMAFQFKKYGQGMYQLIGGQIGKAYRNASPGERAEAVKTLIALAGTHMAMAGALGLPTEPFKYLVMASGLVGGPQWADVEDKIRKVAADVFGKTGGEVFSRGLPRLVNLDLSRMGLDSITSFGEPRSAKDADVKSWFFDTFGGPVASLGFDWGKGLHQIATGDFERAAENMIPIKAASDSLRAYRQATEGKKNTRGIQTSKAYNWQETIQRGLGFGSGREAEEGAANSSYYRQAERLKGDRKELVDAWVSAKPAEKAKVMARITKFNQGRGDDKITPKQLTDAVKRMKKDQQSNVRGIVASKQTKHLVDEGAYNVR